MGNLYQFIRRRYFRWQNASLDILATFSITEDDFVSITVHENELWLVTLDGLRAWRRLELSPQNPVGKRWMVFPLHLPHSIRMVTIGAAGIFALTQGGLVARFQGISLSRPYSSPPSGFPSSLLLVFPLESPWSTYSRDF